MIMPSIDAVTLVNPVSMASVVYWNMAGAGLTLRLRRLNLNKPLRVLIVKSSLYSFSTSSRRKASMFAKKISPLKRSSGTGSGY